MKFSCTKETLERAILTAERFTGKNLSLPVLGSILFETDDSNLTITATNLESAVKIVINGRSQKKGKAAIPAKIFSSLIQSVSDEKIDLEEKQGNVFIKTGSRDARVNGIPPDDFPIFPKIKKAASFMADGFELGKGLEKVLPAVSSSEFKPELNGVNFKVSGTRLFLAATDTFRLAEKIITLSEKADGGSVSFILPQRVAQEAARVFGGEEEVKISLGENQVVFETEKLTIISRLIDGNFPEYSGIIPKEFDVTAFINKREFNDAVRASSIFSSKLQEISLKFKARELEINSLNQEVGEYKTSIPAATTGSGIGLNFNYRYLLDGVNVLDEEEIFMGLNSEQKPSMLRNKEDNSFLYCLMPIRLS